MLFRVRRSWNEQKRCHTLLPLVQLLPTVAAAAAVLFALPRTVPVLEQAEKIGMGTRQYVLKKV